MLHVFAKWFTIRKGMPAEPQEALNPKGQKLLDRAIQCFGDRDRALEWLETPHAALNGRVPFEIANDQHGYQAVVDELGRIEHGIFA